MGIFTELDGKGVDRANGFTYVWEIGLIKGFLGGKNGLFAIELVKWKLSVSLLKVVVGGL